MYTLEKILHLVNAGSDIYCKIYKTDRYITEGWLPDLDLESDTMIEACRLDYDDDGVEEPVLYLA
jgi:hypothetical protein